MNLDPRRDTPGEAWAVRNRDRFGQRFGTATQSEVPAFVLDARLGTTLDTGYMVSHEENAADSHGGMYSFRTGLPGAGGLDGVLRSLPGMQTVIETVQDLAMVDVPVLIEGEAGTGSDFVAHEIHGLSSRRLHPFVTVSSAGVSELNLVNQLWGYERRAFAGATEDQPGLFESADLGTVFFEEVRDLPYAVQMQLARMMKTHAITRVGQSQPRRVNVRLICATGFNLVQEAAEGRFCPDLLYRIRVAQIRLPSLRERVTDIPALAMFYLRQCRLRPDKPLPGLSEEAMGILLGHSWPGNMMELQSAIEFAALRCTGSTIRGADLPPEIRAPGAANVSLGAGSGQMEKDRVQAVLGAAKGNRTLAARLLGISRATLYRRLKELGIAGRE